ncbi:hypothetical protein AMTR_s00110p00133920 [Amborella trichopoda]|uniref:J domain-containing protein n=1 Tax=Amborella trichopoda TaxID=13333 RepID=W1NZ59_AMBTC|nr:hypothetical protein AMTR_s00110p00133920 [Amborella trichopoda]
MEKRCLYEVLGVSRTCSQEEIRSAYRRLALQLHPDKLLQSGVSEEVATARFQELSNAYEVLSDPKERSWYDSHRMQILFSSPNPNSKPTSHPPHFVESLNLFSFFSNSAYSGFTDNKKGFYKVYGDLCDKIHTNEVNYASLMNMDRSIVKDAPLMGNLRSDYMQVSAFYSYWLGFATVMDFCWVDQYRVSEGENRKARRVMDEENKKLRNKARKEYNETVRGLAKFVKKRDKRIIEREIQRNLEQQKREAEQLRKKKARERERLERARAYEEPDWAKVDEGERVEEEEEEEENEDAKKDGVRELYCIVCSKKFKSEKQWKNHEQSKKHREKVAELRVDGSRGNRKKSNGHGDPFIEEFCEEFKDSLDLQEEKLNNDSGVADLGEMANTFYKEEEEEDEEMVNAYDKEEEKGEEEEEEEEEEDMFNTESDLLSDDDEASILEAMVKGHKTRKNKFVRELDSSLRNGSESTHIDDDTTFVDSKFKENSKKKRSEKKESSNAKPNALGESVPCNSNHEDKEEVLSTQNAEDTCANGGEMPKKNQNQSNSSHGRKPVEQSEMNIKRKSSSKGKKQKAAPSKKPGLQCETCGENFETSCVFDSQEQPIHTFEWHGTCEFEIKIAAADHACFES